MKLLKQLKNSRICNLKVLLLFVVFLSSIFGFLKPITVQAQTEEALPIYFFGTDSCPICAQEAAYLDQLTTDGENIIVYYFDITNSASENFSIFRHVKYTLFSDQPSGVPFTVIGNSTYVGFNETLRGQMTRAIRFYQNNTYHDIVGAYLGHNDGDFTGIENHTFVDSGNTITLPLFGEIDLSSISLPILSILIGTVDGFNPCAMWVLLFIITMLFNMKDKRRMWILGFTFLTASALVYLMFMLAWLEVVLFLGTLLWFRLLISVIAILGGSYNLYSYYKRRKEEGCAIIDKEKRKTMTKRIAKITSTQSLALAMAGMVLLAFSVNIVELACSAGLPVIYTSVLAYNDLSIGMYILNIGLYILFFLLDDIIIFTISMKTLQIKGFSTKYGKIASLVGGVIMVSLGILMIVKPEWIMLNF